MYEAMFLLDSGKFASDPDGMSGQVVELIEKVGGSVVAHRPWQDGKLAYEVNGHRKGLHFVVMFRMPGGRITDLSRACKLSPIVIRHMVIHHPQVLFDAMVDAINTGPPEDDTSDEGGEASAERGAGRRGRRPDDEFEE
ncbi:MAG: 30S ribosomal protein S6 [Planctomycetes bacterium]|nr:30S ribosomal protein S6 [Planctomycetota bacterium]